MREASAAPNDFQQGRQMLKAGDSFRGRKDWAKAKKGYEEALRLFQASNNGRFQAAAQQMIDLCEAMPALTLTKMKDGKHEGSDRGYVANVTVEITVKGGKISQLRLADTRENRPGKSQEEVPKQIVSRKTPSVDATSGATITSYALMSAALKAVQQAQPEPKAGAKPKTEE